MSNVIKPYEVGILRKTFQSSPAPRPVLLFYPSEHFFPLLQFMWPCVQRPL